MKLTTSLVAIAAVSMFVQCAQAREQHRHHFHHQEARSHYFTHRHRVSLARYRAAAPEQYAWGQEQSESGYASFGAAVAQGGRRGHRTLVDYSEPVTYRGGVGGRPAAWCGWEMRQLVGSDPGPSYNLARNWAHWGHSGPVGVGAVVVWPHHVGKIVGEENGEWVIESGNDGHRLRTRPRSIAGAIAIRWG